MENQENILSSDCFPLHVNRQMQGIIWPYTWVFFEKESELHLLRSLPIWIIPPLKMPMTKKGHKNSSSSVWVCFLFVDYDIVKEFLIFTIINITALYVTFFLHWRRG